MVMAWRSRSGVEHVKEDWGGNGVEDEGRS